MQVAAMILTLVAIYSALFALGKVAADAEAESDRYKRRALQARNACPAAWRMRAPDNGTQVGVDRG